MGAKLSIGSNSVAVWCDKPVYYSGDLVQGYVLLNVIEPFAARSINVEVVGKEKTSWVLVEKVTQTVVDEPSEHARPGCGEHARPGHGGHARPEHGEHGRPGHGEHGRPGNTIQHAHSGAQRPHTHTEVCTKRTYSKAKREFFRVNVPLHTLNGAILMPGQYQFAFRAVLPSNLPSSFSYNKASCGQREDIHGRVVYKVKAEVLTGPMLTCARGRLLHDCQEIVVRQRLDHTPAYAVLKETTTKVRACLFQSKGAVTVRLLSDKNCYTPGEMVNLTLEVQNMTGLSFKATVAVDRKIVLNTHSDAYQESSRILKIDAPDLAKGASYFGQDAQRVGFAVPTGLAPTTQASLVSCTYYITLELSAGWMTNNPRVTVPLVLHSVPPPHEAYASAPPAYWRPQVVAQPVEVVLPSYQAVGVPVAGAQYAAPSKAQAVDGPSAPLYYGPQS